MLTEMGKKRLSPGKIANRVKWVKALLSGQYAQGNGVLRMQRPGAMGDSHDPLVNSTWCCLGVAGHCLLPNAPFLDLESNVDPLLLPFKWADNVLGLTVKETVDGGSADQNVAASWNDNRRYTFAEIADRIALATDKKQRFSNLPARPAEFNNVAHGDYAREWLTRMESST